MSDQGAGKRGVETPSVARVPTAESPVLPADSQGDAPLLGQWTRRDRWLLGSLAMLILLLSAIQLLRMAGWGVQPLEVVRPSGQSFEFTLDVNSAGWVEWMQLEGIGETTARKIVDDRKRNGPFRSVDDVSRVNGIGPATLEKIRPYLRLEPESTTPGKKTTPAESGGR